MLSIHFITTLLLIGVVIAQNLDQEPEGGDKGRHGRLSLFGNRRHDDNTARDSVDDSRNKRRRNPTSRGDLDGLSDSDAWQVVKSEIEEYNKDREDGLIEVEFDDADTQQTGGSRSRGLLRGLVGGVGTGYKRVRNWQKDAATAVNDAIVETFNGLNYAFSMIPYDQLAETASRIGTYYLDLLAEGVPIDALNNLLVTSVGGPAETIAALMDTNKTAEELQPILMDIGENYKSMFSMTAAEIESFMAALTNGGVPSLTDILSGVTVGEEVGTETLIDDDVRNNTEAGEETQMAEQPNEGQENVTPDMEQ